MIMLVVLCSIQAQAFVFVAYTQRVEHVDELKDAVRYDEAESYYDQHTKRLFKEKISIAVEQTIVASAVDRFGSENTGEQHTNHPTYTMAGEYIECIIYAGLRLPVYHQVRYNGCYEADHNALRNRYVTGSRCDGNQANYCADTEA